MLETMPNEEMCSTCCLLVSWDEYTESEFKRCLVGQDESHSDGITFLVSLCFNDKPEHIDEYELSFYHVNMLCLAVVMFIV